MNEKEIIKSELKDCKLVCMSLPIIALVLTIATDISVGKGRNGFNFKYAFGFGNGANMIFYPVIIGLAIIGFVVYNMWSKNQITVTDKRVYGKSSWGKRVDLPFDSITAVGTTIFSGLAVTTASGAIKFLFLKNGQEIHEAISKLLIDRQNKSSTTTIKQEVPQSNADELKKYKDLLDSGIITQEEFDAKKNQLLGL